MITVSCAVPIASINCEAAPEAVLDVDCYDGNDILLRFSTARENASIDLKVNLRDLLTALTNVTNRNSTP